MKRARKYFYSALLCTACFFGVSTAQEKVAEVKTDGATCTKAVLSAEESGDVNNSYLVAKFIVQGLPEYNSYNCSFSSASTEKVDLRTEMSDIASWLIVVDVSDPQGRNHILVDSKLIAQRLLELMSQQSNRCLLTLARDLKVVEQGKNLKDWVSLSPTIVDKSNTYLWIGLARALREYMPDTSAGEYTNLPRGVILISDGVDESTTSQQDFELLVQEANKMGVPIHAIAFPHKDSSGKYSQKHRHSGFDAMQNLAMRTNGTYLSYEDIPEPNTPGTDEKLQNLLRKTSADILRLSIPLSELKGGEELHLNLRQGNRTQVARFSINQTDLAPVYGNLALKYLYACSRGLASASEKDEEAVAEFGNMVKNFMLTLPNRNEIFSFTTVDTSFAERVHQILNHIDANPALLEDKKLGYLIGNYILNTKATLPQPEEKTASPNVVVNTHNNPSSSSLINSEEDDDIQSWVWWFVAAGGGTMLILFFVLLARIAGGGNGRGGNGGNGGNGGSGSRGTEAGRKLAMLINKDNPGQTWDITKPMVTVGRAAGNDIVLPFSHVSGQHCTIRRGSNGMWQITDNQSTNGITINGSKVSSATLTGGTVITIATLRLEFRSF